MPVANFTKLQACVKSKGVLGYVRLPKETVYILHDQFDYYKVPMANWSISPVKASKIVAGNRFKEFGNAEDATLFISLYKRIKHLGSIHIYI